MKNPLKILILTPARCGVWKRPTAQFLCRGHLNRGYFFNFLKQKQNGKENLKNRVQSN